MVHAVATLVFMLVALGAGALVALMLEDYRPAIIAALGLDQTAVPVARSVRRVRVRSSARPIVATPTAVRRAA